MYICFFQVAEVADMGMVLTTAMEVIMAVVSKQFASLNIFTFEALQCTEMY